MKSRTSRRKRKHDQKRLAAIGIHPSGDPHAGEPPDRPTRQTTTRHSGAGMGMDLDGHDEFVADVSA